MAFDETKRKLYTDMYYYMCLVREFEENIKYLYQQGLATGAMHLSVGEEACAAGACLALRRDDKIITTHRGHGVVVCKGANVKRMIAELLARKDGLCKGRGGSMHIMDVSVGALGAQGIVGAQMPIAVGVALAAVRKKQDYVTAAFFGDGASNTGACHEGMNLASVLNLPVIFICINNGYAVTTKASYSVRAESIAARAASYGFPGVQADGCDPIAVYDAVSAAVDRARNGGGPTLIELEAYRRYGHFVGEPTNYRDKAEEAYWLEERDPIKNHGERLIGMNICSEDELRAMRLKAQKEIEAGNEFAVASPQPSLNEMIDEVYYIKERNV